MADTETPPAQAAAPDTATAIETVAAAPDKTEETTAAPATGTTTTTAEEPGQGAGKEAVGVEGYEKEEAEFLAEGQPDKDKAAAEKWEQAKAAAKKDEELSEAARIAGEAEPAGPARDGTEETDVTGESPATAPESGALPGPEEPAAAIADDDDKDPVRIRIAGLEDGHLVASANRIARKEGITFTEAWERVAPKKSVPEQAAATTTTTEAPKLRTRDEIRADITARKSEKKRAATDLDTGKMYEADESIEALREELVKVDAAEQRAEQERQAAERTTFEKTVASSTTKANEYWPESVDRDSALSKRTVELADAYEKDPALASLVTKADSPFYFTQLAAQEMGLLPKHLRKPAAAAPAATTTPTTPKPATPTATKPAPKNQRAVVSPTQTAASPASGGARTTQEGSGIDSALDKIQGVASYEKLEEEFLTGQLA